MLFNIFNQLLYLVFHHLFLGPSFITFHQLTLEWQRFFCWNTTKIHGRVTINLVSFRGLSMYYRGLCHCTNESKSDTKWLSINAKVARTTSANSTTKVRPSFVQQGGCNPLSAHSRSGRHLSGVSAAWMPPSSLQGGIYGVPWQGSPRLCRAKKRKTGYTPTGTSNLTLAKRFETQLKNEIYKRDVFDKKPTIRIYDALELYDKVKQPTASY